MRIYKVTVGSSPADHFDTWLMKAGSVKVAIIKSEKRLDHAYYEDKEIVRIELVGDLIEL